MDSPLQGSEDTFKSENQIHILLSAADIMNKNEDEEEDLEVGNILESSKCRQCMHCQEGIAAITNTIRNTMIEINEIKERNRERRHQEILEAFKNYLCQINAPRDFKNTHILNPDSSVNQLNNTSKTHTIPLPQLSNEVYPVKETKRQLPVCTQKHQHNTIERPSTEAPPKKSIKTMNLKIETLSHSADAEIIKASQKDELVAMREKMLAMQRRKMEDRERKKRDISTL
ncbi:PREDICTED: uncharacterized protein LOC108358869 [Rhagoletis zephyria]|uniref:uncharacterized protein LOC108358869 n=1 Tax=Rhagoletis zephyria TaxID=28612 RepID=UPI0008113CA4|nr:PREDICTED: uncharacterized protein LOC108358869 [Rhagoletis zephyria]